MATAMTFGRLMYYHRIMKGTLLDGAYGGVSLELGRYGVPLLPDAPTGLLTSGSLFIGSGHTHRPGLPGAMDARWTATRASTSSWAGPSEEPALSK